MIRFAFFGSSEFSLHVLEALAPRGFLPAVIVTMPDKPKGRGLEMAPNAVKSWALERQIPVLDPARIDAAFLEGLQKSGCAVSVVASYGKMIPPSVLDAPAKKTLNVHPSLLPKYRGASPIQSAILDDARETGVTVIRLDEEMDHGPIAAQEKVRFDEWPAYEEVEAKLGKAGGDLLAKILPDWIAGTIEEREQDHAAATFTKKMAKEDGLLDLADLAPGAPADRAYAAFRRIQAYHAWPGAHFFIEKNGRKTRVKITSAAWQNGRLVIEKAIPEGKKEMRWEDLSRGIGQNRAQG